MPRRSARNVVKESEYEEKQVLEVSKNQLPSVVTDVIDDFVAEAESQDVIGNEDDRTKENDQEGDEGLQKVLF